MLQTYGSHPELGLGMPEVRETAGVLAAFALPRPGVNNVQGYREAAECVIVSAKDLMSWRCCACGQWSRS